VIRTRHNLGNFSGQLTISHTSAKSRGIDALNHRASAHAGRDGYRATIAAHSLLTEILPPKKAFFQSTRPLVKTEKLHQGLGSAF
jgi:hypothetical protein